MLLPVCSLRQHTPADDLMLASIIFSTRKAPRNKQCCRKLHTTSPSTLIIFHTQWMARRGCLQTHSKSSREKSSPRVCKALTAEFLLRSTAGTEQCLREGGCWIRNPTVQTPYIAFLCWCNVADWSPLALNRMLSVLRIFLNQH